MKKKIILSVSIILAVLTLTVTFLPRNQKVSATTPSISETTFDKAKVLETRFLNMLNHNYVYNDAIYTQQDIVNNSVIALLNLRDTENESYIKESFVSNYIFNMFGIKDIDYSVINTEFEQKDGFVFIVPRGYTQFSHKMLSVKENEDGSYTVKTKVTISSHDSGEYTDICETLFIKNPESQFGYNIISSVIGSENIEI